MPNSIYIFISVYRASFSSCVFGQKIAEPFFLCAAITDRYRPPGWNESPLKADEIANILLHLWPKYPSLSVIFVILMQPMSVC